MNTKISSPSLAAGGFVVIGVARRGVQSSFVDFSIRTTAM
jgi:hypothetical protein